MTNFFWKKITHVFWDTPPVGNPFLKEFFNFDHFFKKIFLGDKQREKRKLGTTECGNDGMKERLNEGMTECRYLLSLIQKPGLKIGAWGELSLIRSSKGASHKLFCGCNHLLSTN
jgi:hypothetical protein